jgi:hypothetical protein
MPRRNGRIRRNIKARFEYAEDSVNEATRENATYSQSGAGARMSEPEHAEARPRPAKRLSALMRMFPRDPSLLA